MKLKRKLFQTGRSHPTFNVSLICRKQLKLIKRLRKSIVVQKTSHKIGTMSAQDGINLLKPSKFPRNLRVSHPTLTQ